MLGRSFLKIRSLNRFLIRNISSTNSPPILLINSKKSLMSITRSCSTVLVPPDKDKIASEKLKELLKDPAKQKTYEMIQLEVEVMRHNGDMVPQEMRPRYWYELMLVNSVIKRKNFLAFLFKIEKKKEHRAEKKKNKVPELADDPEKPLHMQYRIAGNTFLLRIYDQTINQLWNWRLARAAMFGQKLVIDCGYEDEMTRREAKNCAKQLMYTFSENREADDPYDIYFCNFNQSGELHQNFHAHMPTMYNPEFPINITEKSYLDLFDKKKLVYLTPHCNNELVSYNHDAVYIIGGIVDKVCGKPLSLAKAKREGLKMAKLPITKYLHFGGGSSKSLTINQMISILNDIKNTNDWEFALRHIPKRKLFESRQNQMRKKLLNYAKGHEYCSSDEPQSFSFRRE